MAKSMYALDSILRRAQPRQPLTKEPAVRTTNRRIFLAQSVGAAIAGGWTTSCRSPAAGSGTVFTKARGSGTLRVGIANEKPYGFIDSNGTLQGAMVELLKAVLAPYGIKHFDARIADFDALVPSLLANRTDLIGAGMFVRPSRCGSIAFSDPVSRIGGSFLVKAGNPKHLYSLGDVTRQPTVKVGTQPGVDQQQEVVQSGVSSQQIVLFAKDTEALAGLQAGRVDAIYFPALELNALLATSREAGLERAEPFEQPIGSDGKPIYHYQAFGLRKEDTDLLEAVNRSIATLLASGELLRILGAFGYTQSDMPDAGIKAAEICSGRQAG
jgi:polar amino acid transport system substrate-binding protein